MKNISGTEIEILSFLDSDVCDSRRAGMFSLILQFLGYIKIKRTELALRTNY